MPFLVVIAVSAALAVAAVYYVSQSPTSPLNAGATPTASAPADPDATDAADGTDGSADAGDGEVTDVETPDATEPTEPAPDEDPAAPETPLAPVVDTSTAVRVLNATNRSGVAAGAAKTLTDAGWTEVVADNYTGTTPSTSLVYYKDASSEAAAREVAQLLGITEVVGAPSLVGPVSVVLAGSFQN